MIIFSWIINFSIFSKYNKLINSLFMEIIIIIIKSFDIVIIKFNFIYWLTNFIQNNLIINICKKMYVVLNEIIAYKKILILFHSILYYYCFQ